MAAPSVTNTFVANTTASASEVNANFSDIVDGLSSGSTWDVYVSTLNSGNITSTGTLSVDTIAEKTAANGVAIDGVTLKDSGVTATAGITFNNSTLSYYEEDTSYSAAVTGFSDVTSVTIQYVRVGKLVMITIPAFSGTSDSSLFRITVPGSLRVSSGSSSDSLLHRFIDGGTTYSIETQAGTVFQTSSYLDFRTSTASSTWVGTSTKGLAKSITVSYILS